MKALKIRYAKAVCLSVLYMLFLFAVYVGIAKIFGQELKTGDFCIALASSAIVLHFMGKEDNESNED